MPDYTDLTTNNGQTYQYQVRATGTDGTSSALSTPKVPATPSASVAQPLWLGGFNTPNFAYPQAAYDSMRAKGFRVIRVIVWWGSAEPSRGTFDETYLGTLDTIIARAKTAGLWTVVSMIYCGGTGSGTQRFPAWATAGGGDTLQIITRDAGPYITKIANRYKNESAVAAYDINEPFHENTGNRAARNTDVMSMYAGVISTIRATGDQTIVHVEPAYGDTDIAAANFAPLTDKTNVAYHFHDYFSGDPGGGWDADGNQSGEYFWDCDGSYPDTAAARNNQLIHFGRHRNAANAAGLPCVMGEFGMDPADPGQQAWIRDMVALARSLTIPYFWWEFRTTQCYSASPSDGVWNAFVDGFVPVSPYGVEPNVTPTTSGKLQTTPAYPYAFVGPTTGGILALSGTSSGSSSDTAALTATTSFGYTDATAVDGQVYDYQVRAILPGGVRTSLSAAAHVVMPSGVTTPSTPTQFAGTQSGRTISFTWMASPETAILQAYEVLRDNVVVKTVLATTAPTVTNVDDVTLGTGNYQWAYTGTWLTSTGAVKFGGSDHYSSTTASVATLKFNGTQVQWWGAKASHHGNATVSIDGGAAVAVDTYSPTRQDQVVLWDSPTLAAGNHTLTITVAGTHNAASTGFVVPVDYAVVTSASAATAPQWVEDTAPLGTHSYTVRAVGTDGSRSPVFAPARTFDVVPPAPADTAWTAVVQPGYTTVATTWQAPPAGVTAVLVLRGGVVVSTGPGSAGSFTDNVSQSQSYSYTLKYQAGSVVGPASPAKIVSTSPGIIALGSTADAGTSTTTAALTVTGTGPAPSLVFAAVGDMQNASNTAAVTSAVMTSLVTADSTTEFLGLGDISNHDGSAADYNLWNTGWGVHLGRSWLVPGSHDGYGSGAVNDNGSQYFDYFIDTATARTGVPRTGPRGKGYFTRVLNSRWLLMGLNYNVGWGTQSDPNTQLGFMKQQLDANAALSQPRWVVCIHHKARYTNGDGHGDQTDLHPAWQLLYGYRPYFKLWLCGHENGCYQRFAAMNVPSGTSTSPTSDVHGPTEIVAGTGSCCDGYNVTGPSVASALSQRKGAKAQSTWSFGLLWLRLRATGFDTDFKPISGQSYSDPFSYNFPSFP